MFKKLYRYAIVTFIIHFLHFFNKQLYYSPSNYISAIDWLTTQEKMGEF